jgi:hypothetical protein
MIYNQRGKNCPLSTTHCPLIFYSFGSMIDCWF